MTGRSKDQDLIDELAAWMQAPNPGEATAQTNGHSAPKSTSGPTPDDELVVAKCRAAENAAKFEALFDHGDVHAYHGGDDSRADLSLLGILAFWTQDEGSWSASSPPRHSASETNGVAATTTARGRSARPSLGSLRCMTGNRIVLVPVPVP